MQDDVCGSLQRHSKDASCEWVSGLRKGTRSTITHASQAVSLVSLLLREVVHEGCEFTHNLGMLLWRPGDRKVRATFGNVNG